MSYGVPMVGSCVEVEVQRLDFKPFSSIARAVFHSCLNSRHFARQGRVALQANLSTPHLISVLRHYIVVLPLVATPRSKCDLSTKGNAVKFVVNQVL